MSPHLGLPRFLSVIFRIYIAGISVLFFYRLTLILICKGWRDFFASKDWSGVFLIGFQFDTVVLSYLLAVPLLLLLIQVNFRIQNLTLSRLAQLWLCISFPLSVLLVTADIPYFVFFGNRLSEASFQWMNDPLTILKMITGNSINLVILLIAIILMALTAIIMYRFIKKRLIEYDWKKEYEVISSRWYLILTLLTGVLFFAAMRGKKSHPIRIGDAFYCSDPFLNQAGLNPLFTLMKSYLGKVRLMDDKEALQTTLKILGGTSSANNRFALKRTVRSTHPMRKLNVILILMEGMSKDFTGTWGQTPSLTPVLDSLASVSWSFENAYSAGIHTNNGVFSTLFAYPALRRTRPMSNIPVLRFTGLPYYLKKNGYSTQFFCSHGESFDNLVNFIPPNHFDELITAEDFPKEKAIGPFGVPDDYLFSRAVDKLDSVASPFFATLLTASNHDPYILPGYYKTSFSDRDKGAISYADWSIGRFLTECRERSWYDSTLFIFIADHGRRTNNDVYELSLSYNHIPMIFHSPALLGYPRQIKEFTGQIDVFPIVMGLLGVDYENITCGMDVLQTRRECMYFSADDKIGCINDDWLYVFRFGAGESLYRYRYGDKKDYSKEQARILKQLRIHALSQTQAAESVISSGQTCCP